MQHNWINIQYRLISSDAVVPTFPNPDDPLAALNDAQRQAVEHGVKDGDTRPLLIVAGAGSGKTNTLAHRVAHLIRHGADLTRQIPDRDRRSRRINRRKHLALRPML